MEAQPSIVQQLVDMGFDLEKSKLAYKNAKNVEDIAQVIEYIQNNDELLEKQLAEQKSNPPSTSMDEEKPVEKQEENLTEEQKQEQEDNKLKPISDMVDQALAQTLQDMGHSKIVAEKALFMTQNKKSIEAALDYIEEHKDDDDFNEELFISGSIQKSNLTPEEAKIKAKEMQAELRRKREKMEEENELERERNRIKIEKSMRDAQAKIKEAQREREVKQQVEERKKFQIEKERMQQKLDEDYIERFGMEKFKVWKQKQADKQKELSQLEKTEQCMKALVTAHPHKVFPDKAVTALKTIKIYIEAIIKNPGEEKFRKINSQNAGYKKRVGDCFSGQATLESIGFTLNSEGFLVMGTPDIVNLQKVLPLIEKWMTQV